METKYISKEVVAEIKKLFDACKKKLNDEKSYIKLYDSEELLGTFNDIDLVIDEMDGGDEVFSLTIFDSDDLPKGSFDVLPYEEPSEIISDYTDNFFCEDVMKIYQGKEE